MASCGLFPTPTKTKMMASTCFFFNTFVSTAQPARMTLIARTARPIRIHTTMPCSAHRVRRIPRHRKTALVVTSACARKATGGSSLTPVRRVQRESSKTVTVTQNAAIARPAHTPQTWQHSAHSALLVSFQREKTQSLPTRVLTAAEASTRRKQGWTLKNFARNVQQVRFQRH